MVYTKKQLAEAVALSSSISGVLGFLGVYGRSGGVWARFKKLIIEHRLDTSHFNPSRRGQPSSRRRSSDKVLVLREINYRETTVRLRMAMLEAGFLHVCAVCSQAPEWQGGRLTLQIDHKSGDWRDCRQENLRFLCPNCHSQTSTFGHRPDPLLIVETSCVSCSKKLRLNQNTLRRKTSGPYCKPCRDVKFFAAKPASKEKIEWPNPIELSTLVWTTPVTKLANQLGVSGSAIKKRCKQLGITTPGRGYWSQRQSEVK